MMITASIAMMEGVLLRIGQVAARSGVSIDTLRYYERLGLLPKPPRSRSGYRLYETRVVNRLGFIKRAQRFGFTLDEIGELLRLEKADPHTCSCVLRMIEHRLEDLNRQYREVKQLRRQLSDYKTGCERAMANHQCCPVIENFLQPRGRIGPQGGDAGRK